MKTIYIYVFMAIFGINLFSAPFHDKLKERLTDMVEDMAKKMDKAVLNG